MCTTTSFHRIPSLCTPWRLWLNCKWKSGPIEFSKITFPNTKFSFSATPNFHSQSLNPFVLGHHHQICCWPTKNDTGCREKQLAQNVVGDNLITKYQNIVIPFLVTLSLFSLFSPLNSSLGLETDSWQHVLVLFYSILKNQTYSLLELNAEESFYTVGLLAMSSSFSSTSATQLVKLRRKHSAQAD